MSWYYAEKNERRGPVDDATFRSLVSAGTIQPETLVWREGMAEWTAHSKVADNLGAATATAPTQVAVASPAGRVAEAGVGQQPCAECGGTFPIEDMISYEGRYVCAGCKPVFFQKIREGALVAGEREYAGFGIRFGAKFIDGIIMNIVGRVAGMLIGMAMGGSQASVWTGAGIGIVLQAIYVIYFNGRYGATPGKMACKLQIIRADGSALTYGRATGRYFAEVVSGITLGIGYIMAAFDEEKRALHDRICDTRVVRKR